MLSYRYRAYEPGIKDQVVAMAINGGGIRDTGRVLGIDKQTVMATLKKACRLVQVNPRIHGLLGKENRPEVRLEAAFEAELDEQWSFVGGKANQRWLWYTHRAQVRSITPFMPLGYQHHSGLCVWQTEGRRVQATQGIA